MRRLIAISILAACSNASDPVAPDAAQRPVDGAGLDAPAGPPLDILRVNEVVAAGAPDWIEVVNVTTAPVALADFCYSDTPDDFAICKPFPAMSLAAGAYHAQDIDDATAGFKLGGDEAIYVYRIADHRLSDSIDWIEGDAPANESFARVPDVSGMFVRTNVVTKAAANVGNDPTAPLGTIIINEVAAAESPDWVEIVNVSGAAIALDTYCFVDASAAPCKVFPAVMLAAGAYYVADAGTAESGFGLGGDDAVIVKRVSDLRISDTADWPDGAAGPVGSSYARSPNVTGPFATTATQTKGTANN